MAVRSAVKMAEEFVTFLNKAVSPFHAVEECRVALAAAGFKELREADRWDIKPMNKKVFEKLFRLKFFPLQYFVTRNRSAIVAFAVGGKHEPEDGFSIIGAHTDSPCLKVKPVSRLTSPEGYHQLGVSTYGGALFRTWFDRDLTLAGRIFVEDDSGAITQRLVHVPRPLLYIPNLCIHLEKDRENFNPNKETDLRPIVATDSPLAKSASGNAAAGRYSQEMLADHWQELIDVVLDVGHVKDNERLVDIDLCLVDTQPAAIGGLRREFIAGARLDNLVGTYTAVQALMQAGGLDTDNRIRIACCYDNEECGSQSAQGAGSTLTEWILRRLSASADNPNAFEQAIARSMLISADQAHAVHPNYASKHEDKHKPKLHGGVVVKINSNQRYATTAETHVLLKKVAEKANVPLQKVCVRNDSPCGSTIGPIMAAKLGLRTIDVGCPQLAMHSIREFTDTSSIAQATLLYKTFYESFAEVYASVEL